MSEAVLEALGDLTNGALNYYQTTHVVMAKRKVIETHIEQLQQENQKLKERYLLLENKCIQQKSVIEEISKYINDYISTYENNDERVLYLDDDDISKLLQILDKV